MGSCFSRQQDETTDPAYQKPAENLRPNNKALSHHQVKWKASYPMTTGQLLSKRDDFWDTAPVFGGRPEIWAALKAAAQHAEQDDYSLAQAIIDGANISLPTGTLLEAYDELGNHYEIPVYCLSQPVGATVDAMAEEVPQSSTEQHGSFTIPDKNNPAEIVSPGNTTSSNSSSSVITGNLPRESRRKSLVKSVDQQLPPSNNDIENQNAEPKTVKLRLSSTGSDYLFTLTGGNRERVYDAKARFSSQYPEIAPSPHCQRWFFAGKLLNDFHTLEHVPEKFVIQVIVNNNNNSLPQGNNCNGSRIGNGGYHVISVLESDYSDGSSGDRVGLIQRAQTARPFSDSSSRKTAQAQAPHSVAIGRTVSAHPGIRIVVGSTLAPDQKLQRPTDYPIPVSD